MSLVAGVTAELEVEQPCVSVCPLPHPANSMRAVRAQEGQRETRGSEEVAFLHVAGGCHPGADLEVNDDVFASV